MDDIYGIIPVSKFKECKTRLSPFLSEEERENLLKVMLKDVTDKTIAGIETPLAVITIFPVTLDILILPFE